MKSAFVSFSIGVSVPFKGVERIFANPKIRHAAVIPFMVVLVVFLIGAVTGLPLLFEVVPWVAHATVEAVGVAAGSAGATGLYWLFILLTTPVAVFSLLLVLFLLSQLVAAPFYALLAERSLQQAGLHREVPFGLWRWLKTNLHLFLIAIGKVAVYVVLGVSLLIVSLIPGVGVIGAFGLLLMAAFDIVDFSLEAMQLGLRERLRFFQEEFFAISGLAAILGLVFLVPGLNFFLFPASIVGSSEIIARSRRFQKRG